jgi:hypothetical protein
MNEFIEKNRHLLQFYRVIAQVIGWLLILSAVIPSAFLVNAMLTIDENKGEYLGTLIELIFSRFLVGVSILGVGQLIRYVSEDNYKPGWILRHSDVLLFMWAGSCLLVRVIVECWHLWGSNTVTKFFAPFNILQSGAYILILIGIGYLLRRILPVIEESKTLI